ncbi:MAG TPA: hypothetical protein ENJ09_14570 [Planctomycetes bacterium]|nr:hypothetical protein [Planctomycetota bacterium]
MNSAAQIAFFAAATGGIALGLTVFQRSPQRRIEVRLVMALAPLVLALSIAGLVGFLCATPEHDYSAARLALSTGMLHGYPLYFGIDDGPILSSIYGPVSVLLYLPAAAFSDITVSFAVASATNILSFLLPVFVVFTVAGRRDLGLARAFASLTVGALFTSPVVHQILGPIHVDGPAIGLGFLSCAALLSTGGERATTRRLILAASLAVLAAWSKQVHAPVAIGQLAWLVLARGRREASRYFIALAGCALVSVLLVAAFFGPFPAWFNLIVIPGSHEFYPFGPIAAELARMSLPWLLVLGWSLYTSRHATRAPLTRPFGLFLLCALFLAPTSFLARAKLGGFLNSWHSHAYLILAASLALFDTISCAPARREILPLARRRVALALALLVLAFLPYRRAARAYHVLDGPNLQERTLAFARAHAGEVFFPWNPLVTLLTDGRLYHFEWGVRDREIAGYPPTEAHIRAHLPERLTYVMYPRDVAHRENGPKLVLLEYLKEFSEEVELPDAPDWVAFVRPR